MANQHKTTRPTTSNLQRDWYIVDASVAPLGRIATTVASLLIGKNRADFSRDVDMGASVVVINTDKIQLSGKKPENKVYFWHTGRKGGLKHRMYSDQMAKDSTVVFYKAVKGMLPKNRQQDNRLNNRLFLYKDQDHNHTQKLNTAKI